MQPISPRTEGFFIEDPLIVEQEDAFAVLERFVVEEEEDGSSLFRISSAQYPPHSRATLNWLFFSHSNIVKENWHFFP